MIGEKICEQHPILVKLIDRPLGAVEETWELGSVSLCFSGRMIGWAQGV